MIPQLYSATETGLLLNRIGALSDALSCKVTEELNGQFVLEMEYPIGGKNWDLIGIGAGIEAKANKYGDIETVTSEPQAFIIRDVTRALGGTVTITAEHSSYIYSNVMVSPFLNEGVRRTAQWAWRQALNNSVSLSVMGGQRVCMISSTATGAPHVLVPQSFRSFINEVLIPTWGGELYYNNHDIYWADSRGERRGAKIRYASNLLTLTQEETINDYETSIYPYYGEMGNEDSPYMELPEKIIDYGIMAPAQRILPVDFTSEFETPPTEDQLRTAANAYAARNKRTPAPSSLTVTHVQRENDIPILLGDTVDVYFEQFSITEGRKVNMVVFDVLKERIESLGLGDMRKTLADTILGIRR